MRKIIKYGFLSSIGLAMAFAVTSCGAQPTKPSMSASISTPTSRTTPTSIESKDESSSSSSSLKPKFKVRWVDDSGSLLELDENVEYGTIPTYDGRTPTKYPTVEGVYTFSGWDKEISAVAENITYTATYKLTKNKYTVTWVDEDGTVLEKDDAIEYGFVPTYDGEEPAKESTAEYTYEYIGWDKEISAVTSNVTYTATYKSTKNTYIVIWEDEDGTVLEKDEAVEYGKVPTYDGDTPTKESTLSNTYTFTGWDKKVGVVTEDVTYKAVYEESQNVYKVKFVDYDNKVLASYDVVGGETPTYDGDAPIRENTAQYTYEFAGWDKEISIATEDVIYKATYTSTINTYTVLWLDEDGTVLETDEDVEYGTMASYDSSSPERDDAQYTYSFRGWDSTPRVITGDTTFNAVYNKTLKTYTVTWNNWDDSTLTTTYVTYGNVPSYPTNMSLPYKANTKTTTYEFVGWSPELEEVTGDALYTAVIEEHIRQYEITFDAVDGKFEDGSKTKKINVDYGTIPTFEEEPIGFSKQYGISSFVSWNNDLVEVDDDARYSATYEYSKPNDYFIVYNYNQNNRTVKLGSTISGYTVDWGDGTASTAVAHTYATGLVDGDDYYIRIYKTNPEVEGTLTLTFTGSNGKDYITEIVQYGGQTIGDCSNLERLKNVEIHNTPQNRNTFNCQNSTPKYTTFSNCENLETFEMDYLISYTLVGYSDSMYCAVIDGFENCKNLKSFIINNCLVTGDRHVEEFWVRIAESAFSNCTSLEKFELKNPISDLVYTDRYLQKVYETNKISKIYVTCGKYCFRNCKSLTSIPFKNGSLNDFCFAGCSSLKNVDLRGMSVSGTYHNPFGDNELRDLYYDGYLNFNNSTLSVENWYFGGTINEWYSLNIPNTYKRIKNVICSDGTICP